MVTDTYGRYKPCYLFGDDYRTVFDDTTCVMKDKTTARVIAVLHYRYGEEDEKECIRWAINGIVNGTVFDQGQFNIFLDLWDQFFKGTITVPVVVD